jgi:hypothetical protein
LCTRLNGGSMTSLESVMRSEIVGFMLLDIEKERTYAMLLTKEQRIEFALF